MLNYVLYLLIEGAIWRYALKSWIREVVVSSHLQAPVIDDDLQQVMKYGNFTIAQCNTSDRVHCDVDHMTGLLVDSDTYYCLFML